MDGDGVSILIPCARRRDATGERLLAMESRSGLSVWGETGERFGVSLWRAEFVVPPTCRENPGLTVDCRRYMRKGRLTSCRDSLHASNCHRGSWIGMDGRRSLRRRRSLGGVAIPRGGGNTPRGWQYPAGVAIPESLIIDDNCRDEPLCDSGYYFQRAITKLVLRKDLHGALKDLDDLIRLESLDPIGLDPEIQKIIIPLRIHLKFVCGDKEGIDLMLGRWLIFIAESEGKRSHFWYQESGVGKRMLGDLAGALEDLEKAIQFDPTEQKMSWPCNNYEVLKQRAYVKYLTGDKEGARVDVKMALSFKQPYSYEEDLFRYACMLGSSIVEFLEFRL